MAEQVIEKPAEKAVEPSQDLPEFSELPRSTRALRTKLYERFPGSEVPENVVIQMANLYNDHYAVWDSTASEKLGEFAKEGTHLVTTPNELRSRYLPPGVDTMVVTVVTEGEPAGFAISCRWPDLEGRKVMWVTLLVVHSDFRRRGLATSLLNELRDGGYEADVYGIISPHPAACMALARTCGNTIRAIDHHFIKNHTDGILNTCPLEFIQQAAPYGALFPQDPEECGEDHDHPTTCCNNGTEEDEYDGVLSTAFTEMYIDLSEAWSVLNTLQEKRIRWPLGEVPCGYEYLLCFQSKLR